MMRRKSSLLLIAAVALIAALAYCRTPGLKAGPTSAAAQPGNTSSGLTAVAGIKVGHHTLTTRPTGCTVILTEGGAVGAVDVRGAAPATRETDLLNPENLVDVVHGIVLSGGSAHGLDTGTGVVRYLEQRKIGFPFGGAYVPIVPGAALFDLRLGDPLIRPDAECGFKAAQAASSGPVAEGSVGAGAGATVGKFGGAGRPMKGGIGTASITLPDGLIVAALVAVNAAGDVIDPSNGQVVAGARAADGDAFIDVRKALRTGMLRAPRAGENTTLGVVATNAVLTRPQAKRMAMTAHDGFARAIFPAHTMVDGDTIFALATGTHKGAIDLSRLDALASAVMADAILRAVREATGVPGYPAVRDLKR
jgi:L-aminopeptidase/D-esterase-like protein